VAAVVRLPGLGFLDGIGRVVRFEYEVSRLILRGNLELPGRRYSADLLGGYRNSSRDRSLQPLPGAVAHFQRAMMMDVAQAAKAMRDEEMQAEIEDFLEGFNQPTYRGMRVNGVRVATWSSRDGWSGDSRPEAEWRY
jgi:hypothetical protein